MNIIFAFDAIGLLFIIYAVAIVLANRADQKRAFPFAVLLGLLSLNLFNFMSNTLEWSGITSRFDEFEDFITVVQPVFWVFFFQSFLDIQAKKDLKQAIQEKDILLKEVHHRVKNNLLNLYSLVNLQQVSMKGEESVSVALQDTKQRIQAMGKVHQMLYDSKNFSEIDFASYIKALIEETKITYCTDRKRIDFDLALEPVALYMETAIPAALIFSEVLVNAIKHAFPERNDGHIHVSLRRMGNAFELKIQDNGIGMPNSLLYTEGKTLGLRLIKMLSKQLDGNVTYKKDNGSVFTVIFKNITTQAEVMTE